MASLMREGWGCRSSFWDVGLDDDEDDDSNLMMLFQNWSIYLSSLKFSPVGSTVHYVDFHIALLYTFVFTLL